MGWNKDSSNFVWLWPDLDLKFFWTGSWVANHCNCIVLFLKIFWPKMWAVSYFQLFEELNIFQNIFVYFVVDIFVIVKFFIVIFVISFVKFLISEFFWVVLTPADLWYHSRFHVTVLWRSARGGAGIGYSSCWMELFVSSEGALYVILPYDYPAAAARPLFEHTPVLNYNF